MDTNEHEWGRIRRMGRMIVDVAWFMGWLVFLTGVWIWRGEGRMFEWMEDDGDGEF